MTNHKICKIEGCGKHSKHLGMCLAHYKRFNRYGDPLSGGPSHFKNPDDAFNARIKKNTNNGCIEWTGSSDQKGYGQLRIDGKLIKAHRFAWSRVNGPIPEGMLVLHSCDNPKCVNVDHLRVGTHKDNMADMDDRNRRVNRQNKGEDCVGSKLTEDQVRQIRTDNRRQIDIADDYGISQSVVSKIKLYQTWGHVK